MNQGRHAACSIDESLSRPITRRWCLQLAQRDSEDLLMTSIDSAMLHVWNPVGTSSEEYDVVSSRLFGRSPGH